MHKTPLHEEHIALGAKMVWFAGWDMPIQYTSIIDEHMAVREHSGAFDVSHMGDFLIRGKHAGLVMNTICTNDVECHPIGKCVYAHILDAQGRILDDTIVTMLGQDEFFMVPNAATTDKMRKWVTGHIHGQDFQDMSKDLACIAVQGPTAKDVMEQLTSYDFTKMEFFSGEVIRLSKVVTQGPPPRTPLLADRKPVNDTGNGIVAFVSRTGYTGEDGFEIVCENADAVQIWRAVIDRGKEFGLKPIGLGARDTLRLEKSLLLSGTDFDGTQTSLQTGPGWVIDWKHDFIGKQALVQQRSVGKYEKLVNMIAKDKGIPRHGYEILQDNNKIGTVTSGTLSPVLKQGIAMGYVPLDQSRPGTAVQIKIRDNVINAEIVRPPFVKREGPK